jgi:hypothetical protein
MSVERNGKMMMKGEYKGLERSGRGLFERTARQPRKADEGKDDKLHSG